VLRRRTRIDGGPQVLSNTGEWQAGDPRWASSARVEPTLSHPHLTSPHGSSPSSSLGLTGDSSRDCRGVDYEAVTDEPHRYCRDPDGEPPERQYDDEAERAGVHAHVEDERGGCDTCAGDEDNHGAPRPAADSVARDRGEKSGTGRGKRHEQGHRVQIAEGHGEIRSGARLHRLGGRRQGSE
jgi:hypothetical protein